jgi:hypothetical protein
MRQLSGDVRTLAAANLAMIEHCGTRRIDSKLFQEFARDLSRFFAGEGTRASHGNVRYLIRLPATFFHKGRRIED